jgi:hypothetical protein
MKRKQKSLKRKPCGQSDVWLLEMVGKNKTVDHFSAVLFVSATTPSQGFTQQKIYLPVLRHRIKCTTSEV